MFSPLLERLDWLLRNPALTLMHVLVQDIIANFAENVEEGYFPNRTDTDRCTRKYRSIKGRTEEDERKAGLISDQERGDISN